MVKNSPITLLIYFPEVVDENASILYQTGVSSSNGVLLDCYWSQQLLGPSLLVDGSLDSRAPEVTSDTLVSLEYRCDDVLGGDFLTHIVQFTIRDVN